MKKIFNIVKSRTLTIIFILFLVYLLFGFVIAPIIIKNQIISFIEDEYSTKVEIESASLNPLTFSTSIDYVKLFDKRNEMFFAWDELFINLNMFPLINNTIEIEEIRLKSPNLNIIMLSDSVFNFTDFLLNVNQDSFEIVDENKNETENDWNLIVDKFLIEHCLFLFEDRTLDSLAQFRLNKINAEIHNIHSNSKEAALFNFQLNNPNGGNLAASGDFLFSPMQLNLNLKFDHFNFTQANPYINQFTYLKLEDGEFYSTTDLSISGTSNSDSMDIILQSNFGINNLKLYDTNADERFFEVGELNTSSIRATNNPIQVIIGEVSLNKLYTRIAIDEQQNLNLQKIMKDFTPGLDSAIASNDNEAETENSKDKLIGDSPEVQITDANNDTLDIRIDIANIKIINSEMLFSDFSLPLKFIANIHDLNGEIIGLSKDNPLGAGVDLKGMVDEYGLAKIKGNLNPFLPLDYSDIKMNFNNIELTTLSPYSAKFMGYLIEEGKLTLDIEYQIKKGLLNSYSKIFLNKLTLGDEIETEDGYGFPVKLAIALLKDGDGNIDLDFDVEGDLNDPKTDTGKLVWWAVKRILTSIITAPFNFLGNLLGIGSDDMEYVDFETGSSELLPNQIERINNISKAMNERPGIKLEIYAGVDTVIDKESLQEFKAKKTFTERMSTTAKDTVIDPLKVDVSISRKILEDIYSESYGDSSLQNLAKEFNSKSENPSEIQFDVAGYISKLIRSIVSIQPVTQEELLSLANNRAGAIKNHLITVSQISAERIEITDIEYYDGEDRSWVKCRMGIGAM